MGFIDFILNIAGLLLWLNWCSTRLDPLARPTAKTLLGTLKRAEPARVRRWKFLAGLIALLSIRTVFYWQLGCALDWTPTLNLGAIVLAFRSEFFGRIFAYSFCSFGVCLGGFYLWLLFIAAVNRRVADSDPFQKLLREHLGRVGRWPRWVQLLLPLVVGSLAWLVCHPFLARMGISPRCETATQLLLQSLLIGAGAYLSLKYLIAAFLVTHLLTSYVYLGRHPIWNFAGATARNLLVTLQWAPLRLGKVDLRPVAGIALVFLLAELGAAVLSRLYPL